MTPSERALLQFLRLDWAPADSTAEIALADVAWPPLIQTALEHGVAGLLCRVLDTREPGIIPRDIRAAAEMYLANAEAHEAAVLGDLCAVLTKLHAADMPALAFKGAALGALAHGSATIRRSRDLDILVPAQSMLDAIEALRGLGYRLHERLPAAALQPWCDDHGQLTLCADGRTPVDLHCRFSPRSLAAGLDMDGIWRRHGVVELAGQSVPTLSLEDSLLVACLHGGKEKWWRLVWIADVAALLHRHPEVDWPTLLLRAERSGVSRMLRLGLALAQALFATQLPSDVARAIAEDEKCGALVAVTLRRLFAVDNDVGSVHRVSRYHWDLQERGLDRLRYVGVTMTVPGEHHYRMLDLPRSLVRGYVGVKLVHDYLLLPAWNAGKRHWPRRPRIAGADDA